MGSLFQDARACTLLYSLPCSRCTWGVSFKMPELAQYFILFLAAAAHCGVIPDDPCYREDTNCYEKGVNLVGNVPYLPEIWACELACKETSGCNWFTWYQQDGFHMCYLLDSSTILPTTRLVSQERWMNAHQTRLQQEVQHGSQPAMINS